MLYDYLRRFSRGASRLPFKAENAENLSGESASSPNPGTQGHRSADQAQAESNGPWPPKTQNAFYPHESTGKLHADCKENWRNDRPRDPSRCYPGSNIQAPHWIQHPRPGLPAIINIPRAPDSHSVKSTVIYAGPGSSEPPTVPGNTNDSVISFIDGSYKIIAPGEAGKRGLDFSRQLSHRVRECEPSVCNTCGSIGILTAEDALHTSVYEGPSRTVNEQVQVEATHQATAVEDQKTATNRPKPDDAIGPETGQALKPPEDCVTPGQLRTEPIQALELQAATRAQQVNRDQNQLQELGPDGEFQTEQACKAIESEPWKVTDLKAEPDQHAHTSGDPNPAGGGNGAYDQPPFSVARETPKTELLKTEQAPYPYQAHRQLFLESPLNLATRGHEIQASSGVLEYRQTASEASVEPVQLALKVSSRVEYPEQKEQRSETVSDLPPHADAVSLQNSVLFVDVSRREANCQTNQNIQREVGGQAIPLSLQYISNQNKKQMNLKLGEERELMQNTEKQGVRSDKRDSSQGATETIKKMLHSTKVQTPADAIQRMAMKDEFMSSKAHGNHSVVTGTLLSEIRDFQERTVNDYKDMLESPFWGKNISNVQVMTKGDLSGVEEIIKSQFLSMKENLNKQNAEVIERLIRETSAMKVELTNEIAALREKMAQSRMAKKPTEELARMKEEVLNEIAMLKIAYFQDLASLAEKSLNEMKSLQDELKKEIAKLSQRPDDESLEMKELIRQIQQNSANVEGKTTKEMEVLRAELVREIKGQMIENRRMFEKPIKEIMRRNSELLKEISIVQDKADVNKRASKPAAELVTMKESLMNKITVIEAKINQNIEASQKPAKYVEKMKEDLMKEMASIKDMLIHNKETAHKPAKVSGKDLVKELGAMKPSTIETQKMAAGNPGGKIVEMKGNLSQEIMADMKATTNPNYKTATQEPVREIVNMRDNLMKEIASIKASALQNFQTAVEKPVKDIATMKDDLLREFVALKATSDENYRRAEVPLKVLITMKDELMKQMAEIKDKATENVVLAVGKPVKEIETMKKELMKEMVSIKDEITKRSAETQAKSAPVKGVETAALRDVKTTNLTENATFTDRVSTNGDLTKELEYLKELTIENAVTAGISMKEIATVKEKLSPMSSALFSKTTNENTKSAPNKNSTMTVPQLSSGTTGVRDKELDLPGKATTIDCGDSCSLTGKCQIPFHLLRLKKQRSELKSSKTPRSSEPSHPVLYPLKTGSSRTDQGREKNQAQRKENEGEKVKIETGDEAKKYIHRQPEQHGSPPEKSLFKGAHPSSYPTAKSPTKASKRPSTCFPATNPSYYCYSTNPPSGKIPEGLPLESRLIPPSAHSSALIRNEIEAMKVNTLETYAMALEYPFEEFLKMKENLAKEISAFQNVTIENHVMFSRKGEETDSFYVSSNASTGAINADLSPPHVKTVNTYSTEMSRVRSESTDISSADMKNEIAALKAKTIENYEMALEYPFEKVSEMREKFAKERADTTTNTRNSAVAAENSFWEISGIEEKPAREADAMKRVRSENYFMATGKFEDMDWLYASPLAANSPVEPEGAPKAPKATPLPQNKSPPQSLLHRSSACCRPRSSSGSVVQCRLSPPPCCPPPCSTLCPPCPPPCPRQDPLPCPSPRSPCLRQDPPPCPPPCEHPCQRQNAPPCPPPSSTPCPHLCPPPCPRQDPLPCSPPSPTQRPYLSLPEIATPTCGQAANSDLINTLKKGVIRIEESKIRDYFFKDPATISAPRYSAGKDCPCPPSKPDSTGNKPPGTPTNRRPSSPGSSVDKSPTSSVTPFDEPLNQSGSSDDKPPASPDRPNSKPGKPSGKSPSNRPGSKVSTESDSFKMGRSPVSPRPGYSRRSRPGNRSINEVPPASLTSPGSVSSEPPKSDSVGNKEYFSISGSPAFGSNSAGRSDCTETDSVSSVSPRRPFLVRTDPSKSAYASLVSDEANSTSMRPRSLQNTAVAGPDNPVSLDSSRDETLSTIGGHVTTPSDGTTVAENLTATSNSFEIKPTEWDEKGIAKIRYNLPDKTGSTLSSVDAEINLSSTSYKKSVPLSKEDAQLIANRLKNRLNPKPQDMIWRATYPFNFSKLSGEDPLKYTDVFYPSYSPITVKRTDDAETVQDNIWSIQRENILEKNHPSDASATNSYKKKAVTSEKLHTSENDSRQSNGKLPASETDNIPTIEAVKTDSPSQRVTSAQNPVFSVTDLPSVQLAAILLLSRAAESSRVRLNKPVSQDSAHRKSKSTHISNRNSFGEVAHRRTSLSATPLAGDSSGSPKNTIDITYYEGSRPNRAEMSEMSTQAQKTWPENNVQRQNDILSKLANLPAGNIGHSDKNVQLASLLKTNFEAAYFLRECVLNRPQLPARSLLIVPTDYADADTDNTRQQFSADDSKSTELKCDKMKQNMVNSSPNQQQISDQSTAVPKVSSAVGPQVLSKEQVAESNQKITQHEQEMPSVRETHLKLQYVKGKYKPRRSLSWLEELRWLLPDSNRMDRAIADVLSFQEILSQRHQAGQLNPITRGTRSEDLNCATVETLSSDEKTRKLDLNATHSEHQVASSIWDDVESAIAKILSGEGGAFQNEVPATSKSQKRQQSDKLLSSDKSDKTFESVKNNSGQTEFNAGSSLVPKQSETNHHKHCKEYSNNSETEEVKPSDKTPSSLKRYRPRLNVINEKVISAPNTKNQSKTSESLSVVQSVPAIQVPQSSDGSQSKGQQNVPVTTKKPSSPYHKFKGPTVSCGNLTTEKSPGKYLHTAVSTARNFVGLESVTPCGSESQMLNSADQNPSIKKKLKSQTGPPGCPCAEITGSTLSGDSAGSSSGGTEGRPPNDGSLPLKVKDALNKQMATEMGAFLKYFKMMAHFGRVDVAYRGIETFLRKQVEEERDHALEIASWTNLRGGENQMSAIGKDSDLRPESLGRSHSAVLAESVSMEVSVTKSLHNLRETCESSSDVITSDYISRLFLREQTDSIDEISRLLTNARRAEASPRETLFFDEILYARYKDQQKNHRNSLSAKKSTKYLRPDKN